MELSFHTSKRAYAIVLQEIEKGRCNWKNPDLVDSNMTDPAVTTVKGHSRIPNICFLINIRKTT